MNKPEQRLEVRVMCAQCKQIGPAVLYFSDRLQIVDTDGGMLFNTGWSCYQCLGQPWGSAEHTAEFMRQNPVNPFRRPEAQK